MPPTAETPADVIAALERGAPVPPGTAIATPATGSSACSSPRATCWRCAASRWPRAAAATPPCGIDAPAARGRSTPTRLADQGCTSHFAPALDRVAVSPIRLEWDGPWHLAISVDGGREISWRVTLAAPWRIRLVTTMAAAIPERWWTRPRALAAIAAAVRAMLGTGPLRLAGRLPSGARYLSNPRRVWLIEASRASIRGVDLGEVTRLSQRVALGDFVIPRRALLASGPLFIEPAAPAPVPVPTAAAPSPGGRDRD